MIYAVYSRIVVVASTVHMVAWLTQKEESHDLLILTACRSGTLVMLSSRNLMVLLLMKAPDMSQRLFNNLTQIFQVPPLPSLHMAYYCMLKYIISTSVGLTLTTVNLM